MNRESSIRSERLQRMLLSPSYLNYMWRPHGRQWTLIYQIPKQSATTKNSWVLRGQISFKVISQAMLAHVAWSLSSGYSIYTLHGPCCFIVQLQQSSMRQGGSVFSLLCLIECSACTVHKVTQFYRTKFHSEHQNFFFSFWSLKTGFLCICLL